MTINRKSLSEAIIRGRKDANLSQEQLAESLSLSVRTIKTLESGNANPQYDTLYQVIDFLKIDPRDIFRSDMDTE